MRKEVGIYGNQFKGFYIFLKLSLAPLICFLFFVVNFIRVYGIEEQNKLELNFVLGAIALYSLITLVLLPKHFWGEGKFIADIFFYALFFISFVHFSGGIESYFFALPLLLLVAAASSAYVQSLFIVFGGIFLYYVLVSVNRLSEPGFPTGLFFTNLFFAGIAGQLCIYMVQKRVKEFKSEQSRTQALLKSLSNGVLMFNLNQKVILSNPAIEKITGFSLSEFYLSEFTKLFKEIDLDKKVADTLKIGDSFHIEEANFSDFIYEVFIMPVRDYEKNIIGGAIILHDITNIKKTEKAMAEFVSVASHQLRTPMSSINWFSEMLLNEEVGKLKEEQKNYIQQIYDSNRRMVDLVSDLLNVSRIEAGKMKIEPRPVQLEELIENVIGELQIIARSHNVSIRFEKPFDRVWGKPVRLPKINIDPVRTRQVIDNLISNAIRYNKRKGKVIVSVEKKDKAFLFSCRDTGMGIPREEQDKVFTKFFRGGNAVKAESEGTGLGLYIAKSIVESSGGKVWFESEEGKGSTFYFTLPL